MIAANIPLIELRTLNIAHSELFGLNQELNDFQQFLQQKEIDDNLKANSNDNKNLNILLSMGFDVNEASFALKACEDDIDRAIEILACDIDGDDDFMNNNDNKSDQFESKQEEKYENDTDKEMEDKSTTNENHDNTNRSELNLAEIESKLICFSCKMKWRLDVVEWYIYSKICSLCPDDSIRINFESNESWICPLCIHNAHQLFEELTAEKDHNFCQFKCGRTVSPGKYRSGNSYKTCCRNCAQNKGKLTSISHDYQCKQRKCNQKYNMNGLSLSCINKLSSNETLYLQYKQNQNETVKIFVFCLLFLCIFQSRTCLCFYLNMNT